MPIEAPISTPTSSMTTGWCSASRTRPATSSGGVAVARRAAGRRTRRRRAGPPCRPARPRRWCGSATSCSSTSPCAWPRVSLTSLNPSRSMIMTARPCTCRAARPSTASASRREHQGAVGQPGERVVQRLVPQRLDQPAVLQRHAGVVGDRLEQPDVLLVEGADVAHPVGDGDRADGAGVTAQRRDDRLAQLAGAAGTSRSRSSRVPRGSSVGTPASATRCHQARSCGVRQRRSAVEHAVAAERDDQPPLRRRGRTGR